MPDSGALVVKRCQQDGGKYSLSSALYSRTVEYRKPLHKVGGGGDHEGKAIIDLATN